MRWKRLLLLIPALAVVAAANLRWVCTVRVDGIPLSGSWTPQSIERAERLALEAAGEVARGDTALPYIETEARLSLLPASGDVTELAEVLLCSCEGVCRAWAVSVDGNFLGWAEDISALSESTATRAGFDAEISIEPAAIPSGWETDIDELSGAVRKLARVFYETPDGALRYA